jgi:hypothetical protein
MRVDYAAVSTSSVERPPRRAAATSSATAHTITAVVVTAQVRSTPPRDDNDAVGRNACELCQQSAELIIGRGFLATARRSFVSEIGSLTVFQDQSEIVELRKQHSLLVYTPALIHT